MITNLVELLKANEGDELWDHHYGLPKELFQEECQYPLLHRIPAPPSLVHNLLLEASRKLGRSTVNKMVYLVRKE
jgi:hypothetical protein